MSRLNHCSSEEMDSLRLAFDSYEQFAASREEFAVDRFVSLIRAMLAVFNNEKQHVSAQCLDKYGTAIRVQDKDMREILMTKFSKLFFRIRESMPSLLSENGPVVLVLALVLALAMTATKSDRNSEHISHSENPLKTFLATTSKAEGWLRGFILIWNQADEKLRVSSLEDFIVDLVEEHDLNMVALCVIECAKIVFEYGAGPGSAEKAKRQPLDIVETEGLRKAFTGRFCEVRDILGLSSVDRLNIELRVNLFVSLSSSGMRHRFIDQSEYEKRPFYPYMTLIQSSGSGKSRLLREVGKTLPLVYANLNADDSSGYPHPNTSVRNFLLSEKNRKDRDTCEDRCERLLLVVTILFYLLYSRRSDCRKRIQLPRAESMRMPVKRLDWSAVGIRESPQDGADIFWELAITIADEVQLEERKFRENATSEQSAMSKIDLKKLEMHTVRCAMDLGIISRRQNIAMHSPIDSDVRVEDSDVDMVGSNESPSRARKRAYEELVRGVKKYIVRRIAEGLEGIASSLQGDESLQEENNVVLCGLFIAFDEARCLATSNLIDDQKAVGSVGSAECVNVFRCLRRAAQRLMTQTKVNLFLIFSDTTAKIANFVPHPSLDPSARTIGGPFHVSGQPLPPFVGMGTETAGLMIPPLQEFDFRRRLLRFCEIWGQPMMTNSECVSEAVTSIPFRALLARDNDNGDNLSFASGDDLGIGAEPVDASIFRCEMDYMFLGRPLWSSLVTYRPEATNFDWMISFARTKLLGGGSIPTALGESAGEDPAVFEKRCMAILASRVPLRNAQISEIAPELVAQHMAWCSAVSWSRDFVYVKYINEPLLATAASLDWRAPHFVRVLARLISWWRSHPTSYGEAGECAASILFILMVDRAYEDGLRMKQGSQDQFMQSCTKHVHLRMTEEKSRPRESVRGSEEDRPTKRARLCSLPAGLTMHGTVTLKQFLESGFTVKVETDLNKGKIRPLSEQKTSSATRGLAWTPTDYMTKAQMPYVVFVPALIASAEMRFKSVKRASSTVGCRDIPFLFEANAAVLTKIISGGRRHAHSPPPA